ncbi:hypothetical protein [uncultured Jatrophihabitans sp.]|uniref:hypothetical protein n=1 Tax=uncultured Jatrophihabitans sp. TaxID=1610747 RepID=UPI0035CB67A8
MRSVRGVALAIGTLVLCTVLGATATACSSSPSNPIPSFQPGAGRFRVVPPHPSEGAPMPQILR